MTKHTPGPWTVVTSDQRKGGRLTGIVPPDETKAESGLATVNRLYDEWEANARLIAAAPDLLSALRGVLAYQSPLCFGDEFPSPTCPWCLARAAIAKAEGRG